MIKWCVLHVYEVNACGGGLCPSINVFACYIHRITEYISHSESELSCRALTVVHIGQTRPTFYSELKTNFYWCPKNILVVKRTSDNAQIIGIINILDLSLNHFIMCKSQWFEAYFLFMIFS
jgi:hypothetical protein